MFVALKRVADWAGSSWNFGGELRNDLFNEFMAVLTVAIPALVMMKVERRPWGAYGLPPRRALDNLFWVGAVWGFLGITLLLAALHGVNAFDFGHLALHGVRIAKYAAYWGAMFLLVGLFEEFLFRGYTQFTLARGLGFWPAALVMSVGFGGVHWFNPGETLAGVFAAGFIGLFFCLTLRRTGSLWFAVGFHAAWDWGETFFYSVPDSGIVAPGHLLSSSLHGKSWLTGGSVGPEGSVFCFVVIGAVWVAFERVYRGASEPTAK
jgi:membrane protease YdiL (CAAX protease family)